MPRANCSRSSACAAASMCRSSTMTYIDQKRVELARALASDPRVLLLDEWLAGLNPSELSIGIELIEKLSREGRTIIMVEHVMDAIRIAVRTLCGDEFRPQDQGRRASRTCCPIRR